MLDKRGLFCGDVAKTLGLDGSGEAFSKVYTISNEDLFSDEKVEEFKLKFLENLDLNPIFIKESGIVIEAINDITISVKIPFDGGTDLLYHRPNQHNPNSILMASVHNNVICIDYNSYALGDGAIYETDLRNLKQCVDWVNEDLDRIKSNFLNKLDECISARRTDISYTRNLLDKLLTK